MAQMLDRTYRKHRRLDAIDPQQISDWHAMGGPARTYPDLNRHAADYVDKILRGGKAGHRP
jgi:hypothetical protein